MIISITEKERDYFLPLVPEDMRDAFRSGEWMGLGALSEPLENDGDAGEDGAVEACGIMLFSPEDGISIGGERSTMIILHWIYVADKYRQQGMADDLMNALADILEDNPADGIICDIPLGSEYDLAEDFFSSWGFSFDVTELQEMVIDKDDCRKEISPQNKEEALRLASGPDRPINLIPISELSKEDFIKTVRAIKEKETSGYYEMISEDRDDYAEDISCAFVHENEVSSMVLFERFPDDDLHMVMLGTLSKRGNKELLELLRYTAGYYYLNYPESAKIKFSIGTERNRTLAVHLFPDKDPILVRRGFYY